MNVGAEARDAALREIAEFGELQAALEDRDAAQEELRKCQQDAIQLQARLAKAEKWDEARVKVIHELHERANKAEARLAEAEALLRHARQFIDDPDIDAFLSPDSASACLCLPFKVYPDCPIHGKADQPSPSASVECEK